MDQVDFHYVDKDGHTIYLHCFDNYLNARLKLERSEADCSKLIPTTETVFEHLVKEGHKYGYDVDSILEIPTASGQTCFAVSSRCSKKISDYIIQRRIKLNSINTHFMVPVFQYPDLSIIMMKEGINPHIIDYTGISQIDVNLSSFESEEAKQLLAQFSRSVHFSIDDINCSESCPADCTSSLNKYYCKNEEFVKMIEKNRIGKGGFGSVFKGKFHGKDKALKCVLIGQMKRHVTIDNVVSDLEKNISEIRIQMASGGSGIIVPEAFVRQQNQEKDANGKWIAKNYNIFIYPLYDCNLYELHENHFDQFTEEIVGNIINQCFNRKG